MSNQQTVTLYRPDRGASAPDTTDLGATGLDTYLQFLNHELRTPLTAVGAALQTLSRQLGDVEELPQAEATLALVDLAHRNLQRLQRAVEWAGDFTAGAASGPEAVAPVGLLDLLEDIDEIEDPNPVIWSAETGDWSQEATVAREDWRRLLRQIVRAHHFFSPTGEIEITVSQKPRPEAVIALRLTCRLRGRDRNRPPVDRTGTGRDDEVESLGDLIAVNVSPALWDSLDGSYAIARGADGPVLTMDFRWPSATRLCVPPSRA